MGCCSSAPAPDGDLVSLAAMPKVKAEMEKYNVKFKRNFAAKYRMGRKLGEGQFGTVYEAHSKTGEAGPRMAAKVVWKAKLEDPVLDSVDLISEISVMMQLNHPNIVRIFDVYEDNQSVIIVEELVDGGELFQRIVKKGAYSEAQAREYIREIVLGIAHCHGAGIVHRDLKPENILMTDKSETATFKICDFGFAKRLGRDGFLRTQLGTEGYKAPELLVRDPCYTEKVDCWSMGVIFFIMLSGGLPFYEDEHGTIEHKVRHNMYAFEADEWRDVSETARDFIKKILVLDPKKRLSCEQMLAHRWLTRENVPNQPLHALVERIKGFNARRRLRGAIKGVQAGLRLHHLASHHAHDYGSMSTPAHAGAGAGGAGAGSKAKGDVEERKAQTVGK